MKRKSFIALFIGVHLIFIILQIDKQSKMVRLSYLKQHYEKELATLTAQSATLAMNIQKQKNKKKIKLFAQKELGMQPLVLKTVKRIPKHANIT